MLEYILTSVITVGLTLLLSYFLFGEKKIAVPPVVTTTPTVITPRVVAATPTTSPIATTNTIPTTSPITTTNTTPTLATTFSNFLDRCGITPELTNSISENATLLLSEMNKIETKSKTVKTTFSPAIQQFLHRCWKSEEMANSYFDPFILAVINNLNGREYKLWHDVENAKLVLEPSNLLLRIPGKDLSEKLDTTNNALRGANPAPGLVIIVGKLATECDYKTDNSTDHGVPQNMELLLPLVIKDFNQLALQHWRKRKDTFPVLKLSRKNDFSALGTRNNRPEEVSEKIDGDNVEEVFVPTDTLADEIIGTITNRLDAIAETPNINPIIKAILEEGKKMIKEGKVE